MRSSLLALAILCAATPLCAQNAPAAAPTGPALMAVPSTRATTTLQLSFPRVQGQPAAKPLTVTIDYGQPHARGRAVPLELAIEDSIWRTGANSATTMTTEANLVIGGTALRPGAYSLYTIKSKGTYYLIVNGNTGQWGTEYAVAKDVARIPMRVRTNAEVRESLQIALVPAADAPARGVLTIAWGKLELTADWATR